jgi:hypothetical protein
MTTPEARTVRRDGKSYRPRVDRALGTIVTAAGRCLRLAAFVMFALLVAVAGAHGDAARSKGRAPRREVPNYDGRGPALATPTDALLALPRAVLYPIRLVFDYGVRRPIGFALRAAERSRTMRRVARWLFLQPKTPTPQIIPTAMYDFGFKPSIGVRLYWDDGFLTPGSELSIKLGTGGLDMWRADLGIRVGLGGGGKAFVSMDAGARQRPDQVFYGLGPDAASGARARYLDRRLHTTLRAGGAIPHFGDASVFGGVTDHHFADSTYAGDPTIEDQVAAGLISELPAGYADGYTAARAGVTVALDTRPRKGRRTTSGARLDATIQQGWDINDRDQTWTRIDVTAGAALLLDAVGERKLDVKLRVQNVAAAMDTDVPFLELPTTGGLRGFAGGRLRGDSAVSLTADYDWPLGAWVDAHAHAGVGNAFDRGLTGFSAGALRGSAGLGLSIAGLSSVRQVRISAAVGTEPLASGVDISSFRLVLGFANDY